MAKRMAVLASVTKNKNLISDLKVAQDFWDRGLGLIPKKNLEPEQGLWISRCKSIHTCFMSFAIDCVFVDKNLKVQALVEEIQPWRMTKFFWKADSVFELSAGSIRRLQIELGDQLNVGS
jgi:uncharacterized membrane protein (UPF0127 family)